MKQGKSFVIYLFDPINMVYHDYATVNAPTGVVKSLVNMLNNSGTAEYDFLNETEWHDNADAYTSTITS